MWELVCYEVPSPPNILFSLPMDSQDKTGLPYLTKVNDTIYLVVFIWK